MEDCTQLLDVSSADLDISGLSRFKVGSLVVNGTSHDIYRGENVIGRDELSDIVIRNDLVSSKHAVVEVEDWDSHMIYDCGSLNKTKVGKRLLKPNVRYYLEGSEEISFANVKATYNKLNKPEMEEDDDNVSEAGSESILNSAPLDEETEINLLVTNQSAAPEQGYGADSRLDSVIDLNNSSFIDQNESNTTKSNLKVIDASDDSTDNEIDFIPPSQTVKEFASSRQANFKNKLLQNNTEELFGDNLTNQLVAAQNVDDDIFNMETQKEQEMSQKDSRSNMNCFELNTQNIFSAETQRFVMPEVGSSKVKTELEAQEEEVVSPPKRQNYKENEHQPRVSRDIFDAETELQENICIENELVRVQDISSDEVNIDNNDISDALTQVNVSLVGKNVSPSENFEDQSISDALTQLNTTIPIPGNTYIKKEIDIKVESDGLINLDTEVTQVNLQLIRKIESDEKPLINRNCHTSSVDEEINLAAEATQVNLQLVGKIEYDEKPITNRNCQSRPPAEILNIEAEETQPNLKLYNLFTNSRSESEKDGNISDLLTQPNQAKNYVEGEDSDSTDIEGDCKQREIEKAKADFTSSHMDICSTVGNGTYISSCTTLRKTPSDSGLKRPLSQNSLKKTHEMIPIPEECAKKSRVSKKLISDEIAATDTFNHSIFLNEPCGSSTPFSREEQRVNKKNKIGQQNTSKITPGKVIERESESPDLPTTEELLEVANVMEGHTEIQSSETNNHKEKLPLALTRTPRIRKLSKKLAETLEVSEKTDSKSLRDSNIKSKNSKEKLSTNKPSKEGLSDDDTNPKDKVEPTKRKKKDEKDLLKGLKIKKSMISCDEEEVRQCFSSKTLLVELTHISDISKTALEHKESCVKRTNEWHSPSKKKSKEENNSSNIEHNTIEAQSIVNQRSTRKKKCVDSVEVKAKEEKKLSRKNYNKRELVRSHSSKMKTVSSDKSSTNFKSRVSQKEECATAVESRSSDVLINVNSSIDLNNDGNVSDNNFKANLLHGEAHQTVDMTSCKKTNSHDEKLSVENKKICSTRPTVDDAPSKTSDVSGSWKATAEHVSTNEDIALNQTGEVSEVETSRKAKFSKKFEQENSTKHTEMSLQYSTIGENITINKRKQPKRGEICKGKMEENINENKSCNESNNEPEKITRRNRRKKENIVKTSSVEQLASEINSLKCNSTPRSKRKIKESLLENPINTKVSKFTSDNEVSDNFELKMSNIVEDKQEKIERERCSTRTKTKPARFRGIKDTEVHDSTDSDKDALSRRRQTSSETKTKPARLRDDKDTEVQDSIDSDKDSLSRRRQKSSEISTSVESVESSPVRRKGKQMKDTSVFASPSTSKSLKTKKENEAFRVPVVEDRCRLARVEHEKQERSRSRSDSVSSQSSVKSNNSSVQSPRRSVAGKKRILFSSGLCNPTWESQIKKLGGSVVTCPLDCSVLVTDKVRRTVKFLCVLGQGKPIVTTEWINKSWQCTGFEEPMDHLLSDKDAEKRFNFSLARTMKAAQKQPLLKGLTFHATPHVQPPPDEIKSIVECCGGEYLEKIPSKWPVNSIVISHEDDKALWKKLKVKGSTPPIVSAEMLLIGVLRHNLEVEHHRIS